MPIILTVGRNYSYFSHPTADEGNNYLPHPDVIVNKQQTQNSKLDLHEGNNSMTLKSHFALWERGFMRAIKVCTCAVNLRPVGHRLCSKCSFHVEIVWLLVIAVLFRHNFLLDKEEKQLSFNKLVSYLWQSIIVTWNPRVGLQLWHQQCVNRLETNETGAAYVAASFSCI